MRVKGRVGGDHGLRVDLFALLRGGVPTVERIAFSFGRGQLAERGIGPLRVKRQRGVALIFRAGQIRIALAVFRGVPRGERGVKRDGFFACLAAVRVQGDGEALRRLRFGERERLIRGLGLRGEFARAAVQVVDDLVGLGRPARVNSRILVDRRIFVDLVSVLRGGVPAVEFIILFGRLGQLADRAGGPLRVKRHSRVLRVFRGGRVCGSLAVLRGVPLFEDERHGDGLLLERTAVRVKREGHAVFRRLVGQLKRVEHRLHLRLGRFFAAVRVVGHGIRGLRIEVDRRIEQRIVFLFHLRFQRVPLFLGTAEINVGQRFVRLESAHLHLRNGRGDVYGLEGFVIIKGISRDHGKLFGQRRIFQSAAIIKGAVVDLFDGIGDHDFGDLFVINECAPADGGHAFGECGGVFAAGINIQRFAVFGIDRAVDRPVGLVFFRDRELSQAVAFGKCV